MRKPKKATTRPWGKEDLRALEQLARKKETTPAIAKKLNRTIGAVYQQAAKRSVKLGTRPSPRKRAPAPQRKKAARNAD